MGSGIGSAFGKKDPNATNDTLNGQVVATGTPGAKTVADPDQGLGSGQLAMRRALLAGGGALSQMGGQQAQPRSQPAQQINFAPPSPQYQPPLTKYAGNPFFGQ